MDHDLKDVPFPLLQRRAIDGDPAALAALEEFGAELRGRFEGAGGGLQALADRATAPAFNPDALAELPTPGSGERERMDAMLAEMAAMRQAVEAAEGREREAVDIARRNYWAAVVAIVVAILIAVFG